MSTISLAPPPLEGLAPSITTPSRRTAVRWPVLAAILSYSALIIAAVRHHEPWADEAQAWLLGRDASLWDLWTKLLHYEGSPGLWQSLLHALIALGLPYSAYNYLGALCGIAAAWLVMRYSPFPLAIRLALPFTFFLGYQYVVIARSYDLVPLLLFGCAILYKQFERRVWLFTMLLCLLAAVSVHGIILSVCITASLLVSRRDLLQRGEWRRIFPAAAVYLALLTLVMIAAWPARDITFVTHSKSSLDNWLAFSQFTLSQTFTGEGYSTAAILALSLPFLWRGRGLFMFASATLILVTFGSIVYAHVWHQGLIFLAWLFAIWISVPASGKLSKLVIASLTLVIACHIYWTAKAVAYDWKHSYSAGKAAAGYLRDARIPPGHLYAVGYASTAAKPYFPPGTFAGGPAYWDWSVRNRMNDPARLIASAHREYVAVGFKNRVEQDRWATLLTSLGYVPVQHLIGDLFWHDRILEPESFDIYRHPPGELTGLASASAIPMNDGKFASQLLSGFYPVEGNAWRWTLRNFAISLKPPPGAGAKGAVLELSLYFPDQHIAKLGPVTLSAAADGFLLAPRTFSRGGSYTYAVRIPGSQLHFDSVCVNFELNKAVKPSESDSRELGAIVTSAGFRPE